MSEVVGWTADLAAEETVLPAFYVLRTHAYQTACLLSQLLPCQTALDLAL